MHLGIRGKLFLLSVLLVAVAMGAAELLVIPRLEAFEVTQEAGNLERLGRAAADALGGATTIEEVDTIADRMTALLGVRVSYIAADGTVIGDGDVATADLAQVENHATRPEVMAARAGHIGSASRQSTTVGLRFLYLALPASAPGGVITRVALPLTEVDRAIADLRRLILVTAGLGLLVAAILSSLTMHFLSGPLREMTRAAQALAERRFDEVVRVRSHDELGAMAGALNRLAGDLQHTLGDLTAERDLLSAVLEGMVEGVLVSDTASRVIATNPAVCRQLGIAPSSGQATILELTRNPELAEQTRKVVASGAPLSSEVELPGPPPRFLRMSSAPLAGSRGTVTVFHDVSELRRLERVRRDFVANVSHELRTPVAALQAAGETLRDGALDDRESARQFVDIIARNAERLGRLVSDLLDLARLDSGQLDLKLDVVAVRPVVDRVLEGLAPRLSAKRMTAANEVPAALSVRADARGLEQMLANYLDNATRYTPEGGSLGVETTVTNGFIRIVVWDTGPGLMPHHRERVFERFYRVDPGRSRELGGTGLGLAIVKHLVEAMGGKAGVDERQGGGSRFWFTLPGA